MTETQSFFIPSLSNKRLFAESVIEGGFGKVFITQSDSGNKYALKTLKWELNLNRELFFKETKKLLDIPPHKNVIQIIDIIKQDDIPFICMPYCFGNLRQQMQSEKITTKQIEKIVTDIATGLNHVHSKANVLHLDLKPENILVDRENNYLLSDFGISKVLPEPKQNSLHTQLFLSGLSGTITYMSPEHFVSQEVSDKSDVFAFGVILFELLTGNHPFLSDTLEQTVRNVLYKQITFSVIESFKYPKLLRRICLASLNKNPINRPTSKEIIELLASGKVNINEQDDFDYGANINRANSLAAAGRIKESEELLKKCISKNPYHYLALLNLADIYFRQSKFQDAVDASEKLLEMVEWNEETSDSLGTLYVNLSNYYMVFDPMKSMTLAKKAIAIDPKDWQAMGNLAESCRAIGDKKLLDEGLSVCKKALEINPKDLKLRVTLGGILLAKGDIDTLWPLVVEVSNEAGDYDATARFLLIKTLIFTGQVDDALRYLKAMRGVPELREYIAQLDKQIDERRKEITAS